MDDKEYREIYDTTIYTDFSDLPKERQKELYNEYLSSRKDEKRLTRFFIFIPLCFGCAIILLLAASVVVYFLQGPGALLITVLCAAMVVVVCFIVVSVRLDKVKEEHERRFIDWLKTEKRVIAVLKRDVK